MRRTASAAAAFGVTLSLIAGGCTGAEPDPSPGTGAATVPTRADGVATAGLDLRLAGSLRPFDACDELLDHVRAEATAHGTLAAMARRTGGFDFFGDSVAAMPAAAQERGAGVPAPTAAPPRGSVDEAAPGTAPNISGTNVQEAGVDEPDTVKTDGRRIFALAQGRLQVLDIADGHHRLTGSLLLPGGGAQDLLLAGDRALVRSSVRGAQPTARLQSTVPGMVLPGGEHTVLTLVDVSDAADPRVLSTFEVDGRVVGARMVGDVVRVVVSAAPQGFVPLFPQGPTADDQAKAEAANQRQIERSTVENWLPGYRVDVVGGNAEGDGQGVVDCERVHRPAEFSGLGTVSVLTFDLSAGLGDGDAVTVLTDGDTVYASVGALYVATPTIEPGAATPDRIASLPAPVATATSIHKFDISGPGPARHVASGSVRGRLLNQFSMSEHDGRLRVATTDGFATGPGAGSESFVTVLEHRDAELAAVGSVDNLGRGEQIYAVRFLGDVGYVVTFRQTDPLYTVDLSDPARPRVAGELKIPGYSAYLHPVGEGRLLGIGQDATETGQRLGAQVSLFDVSDPARPQRLDQEPLGQGSAQAEYDHHAFLWWAPRGLAVLPLQAHQPVPFSGAVGLAVAGDRLEEVARITHDTTGQAARFPGGWPGTPITRSLVVGDVLFTLSDAGILASAVDDLAPGDWVAF